VRKRGNSESERERERARESEREKGASNGEDKENEEGMANRTGGSTQGRRSGVREYEEPIAVARSY